MGVGDRGRVVRSLPNAHKTKTKIQQTPNHPTTPQCQCHTQNVQNVYQNTHTIKPKKFLEGEKGRVERDNDIIFIIEMIERRICSDEDLKRL